MGRRGWQDGSLGKGAWSQAWRPGFNPSSLHGTVNNCGMHMPLLKYKAFIGGSKLSKDSGETRDRKANTPFNVSLQPSAFHSKRLQPQLKAPFIPIKYVWQRKQMPKCNKAKCFSVKQNKTLRISVGCLLVESSRPHLKPFKGWGEGSLLAPCDLESRKNWLS